jgi:Big-like domain-containing protein
MATAIDGQSSNTALATVSSSGVVTGIAVGDTDIRVTYQNVTESSRVTVGPPSVRSVAVSGSTPAVGSSSQFMATAMLSNSTTQSVTNDASWLSANTAVLTVSTSRLVRAIAGGDAMSVRPIRT